jgi:hypothetical protein
LSFGLGTYKIQSTIDVPDLTVKLDNRFQRVTLKDIKLNKVSSKWEHIKHGVPQGSI